MRKERKALCIAALIICTLLGYGFAHVRMDTYRADFSYKLHAAVVPVPVELIGALAGEFKGLFGDYLLLEAASFIGSRKSFAASPEDWDAVARLMIQSNTLDPYFRSTYFLAQGILAWRAQEFDETLLILENSKKHLTWDWHPGFFLGFDHFYFLKDNLTASNELMEASKIDAAPVFLPSLASRLAAEAGQFSAAIDFLTVMYEKTKDEQTREQLRQRILALQGAQMLQDAVQRFESQHARMPHDLDELVTSSIIPAIPVNPYQHPYTLKEGKVQF